ncbi:MAG TPA: four helix bundle protein [Patescibacteria group bacterium]|jgi:four helix bundle protein|nr:four helix bundle protein [Patescibacteria group bacterium]
MNTKNGKIQSFTDLLVWQEGHRLVIHIYEVTTKFPPRETYSLTDQMRRAASSVTSNIAEGFGRQGYKEKLQFYYLAQGSLTELKNQLFIAHDVGYLKNANFQMLIEEANQTHRLLQGLLTKTKYFLNLKS